MKIVSMWRNAILARTRRRVTPSPASMMYGMSLTIKTLDDCARPTVGLGPARVPKVIRRVPVFVGAVLVWAVL
jgi:hypothetical protein